MIETYVLWIFLFFFCISTTRSSPDDNSYKDKASIDAHGKDPKFQEMAAQFGDSVDMKLYVSQPVAGFEDRAAPSVKM